MTRMKSGRSASIRVIRGSQFSARIPAHCSLLDARYFGGGFAVPCNLSPGNLYGTVEIRRLPGARRRRRLLSPEKLSSHPPP